MKQFFCGVLNLRDFAADYDILPDTPAAPLSILLDVESLEREGEREQRREITLRGWDGQFL